MIDREEWSGVEWSGVEWSGVESRACDDGDDGDVVRPGQDAVRTLWGTSECVRT